MRQVPFVNSKALIACILCAIVLFCLTSCSMFSSQAPSPLAMRKAPPQTFRAQNPELPYSSIDLSWPASTISNPRIYVLKHERRLWVVNDNVLVRDYMIGLGDDPLGDKKFIGDGRTPEGQFYICTKNWQSKFYKSFGLNYPDPQHAEQGYRSGLISRDEYRDICRANDIKCLPPCGTRLGGDIFIHGGGGFEDWTKGCIAVSNSAMDELFKIVNVGTPVQVMP